MGGVGGAPCGPRGWMLRPHVAPVPRLLPYTTCTQPPCPTPHHPPPPGLPGHDAPARRRLPPLRHGQPRLGARRLARRPSDAQPGPAAGARWVRLRSRMTAPPLWCPTAGAPFSPTPRRPCAAPHPCRCGWRGCCGGARTQATLCRPTSPARVGGRGGRRGVPGGDAAAAHVLLPCPCATSHSHATPHSKPHQPPPHPNATHPSIGAWYFISPRELAAASGLPAEAPLVEVVTGGWVGPGQERRARRAPEGTVLECNRELCCAGGATLAVTLAPTAQPPSPSPSPSPPPHPLQRSRAGTTARAPPPPWMCWAAAASCPRCGAAVLPLLCCWPCGVQLPACRPHTPTLHHTTLLPPTGPQVEEEYPLPKSMDDMLRFRWVGVAEGGWQVERAGSCALPAGRGRQRQGAAAPPRAAPSALPFARHHPCTHTPRPQTPTPTPHPCSVMPQDHLNYAATWWALSASTLALAVKAIRQGMRAA